MIFFKSLSFFLYKDKGSVPLDVYVNIINGEETALIPYVHFLVTTAATAATITITTTTMTVAS